MKYRNGVTNIGVLCGFAALDAQGRLLVHQNACREMAFVLDRTESARAPEFEYEPVTVIYQLIPGPEGEQPRLSALHVTRMARSMLPKTFYWNSQDWPLNLEFYPFRPDKAGTLTDDLLEAIADESEYPEWLRHAAFEDDSLADLISKTSSNKHLQNRLLITGHLRAGEMVAVPREVSAHDYLRVHLRQPGDSKSVGMRMNPGVRSFHYFAGERHPEGGIPVTAVAKATIEIEFDADERVTAATLDYHLLEANTVTQADVAA